MGIQVYMNVQCMTHQNTESILPAPLKQCKFYILGSLQDLWTAYRKVWRHPCVYGLDSLRQSANVVIGKPRREQCE